MKAKYEEGTWFAVPLCKGGYAAGVVARHVPRKKGGILGYFFGPKRDELPKMAELDKLDPGSAISVLKLGDLGLIEGDWPIIGESADWQRDKWPIPQFIRQDEICEIASLITYDDHDPAEEVSEKRVPYDTTGYEEDASFGSRAVEIELTELLS